MLKVRLVQVFALRKAQFCPVPVTSGAQRDPRGVLPTPGPLAHLSWFSVAAFLISVTWLWTLPSDILSPESVYEKILVLWELSM